MEIQAETMSAQVQRNKYHIARNVKGVTDKYAAPGFWLADKKKAAGRLLTEEEIRAYNRQICDTEGCKVTDITKLPETVTKRQVSELIASYEMPDHRFLDGVPITDGQREALMEKRNLKALQDGGNVRVQYGIIVRETAVRTFPTLAALTEAAGDRDFDYFQETTLKVGEGVWIYHTDQKGTWLFVQTKNYAGWIKKETVAFCSGKKMTDYLTGTDFAIVTKPVTLQLEGEDFRLAMGCRLPVKKDWSGKIQMILRPVSDGGELAYNMLPMNEIEYADGYLPYTTAFVLDQAMKLLNINYGWGGKDGLLDCSSVVLSVYECFGFSLPRNTSDMEKLQGHRLDVAGMSEKEMRKVLGNILPGSLLLMKGHVMIYLGMKEDTVYALHAFTKYLDEKQKEQSVMQCTITPLDIKKADGMTYLEAVRIILEILPDEKS